MAEGRFIIMQCPSCEKGNPNTWDILVSRWQDPFICDGCGTAMLVDREEALAARDRASVDDSVVLKMRM